MEVCLEKSALLKSEVPLTAKMTAGCSNDDEMRSICLCILYIFLQISTVHLQTEMANWSLLAQTTFLEA